MLVQFNTDKNIDGTAALASQSEEAIRNALTHFTDQITRIEMHVSDENSSMKEGDEAIRCKIEARLSGRRPIAVSHSASTVSQSVDGAADKMKRAVEGVVRRRESVARKRMTSHANAIAERVTSQTEQEVTESPVEHADGATRRPESPELEGRDPLPEEITGRASATDEALTDLFDNTTAAHLADGFRGGSDDDTPVDDSETTRSRGSSDDGDRLNSDTR